MAIERRHLSVFTNILAALIFCSPNLFFYLKGMLFPMFLYSAVMFYSMIAAISNIKYAKELDAGVWNRFYHKTYKLRNKLKAHA
jgi:hypothetical protein